MPSESPFPGIDPYVNSYLQNGHWDGFHLTYTVYIGEELDKQLPQGYGSVNERSLQRREIEDEDYKPLSSVVIYDLKTFPRLSKAFVRIEVIHPENKPNATYNERYQAKRLEWLKSGIPLIEIDYLHETSPIIRQLPSYTKRDSGAFPYTIAISDPRPNFNEGRMLVYGVGIDEALPKILIPLDGKDSLMFDLGSPYRQAISGRIFRSVMDYSQLPLNFERYSPVDQERIRKRVGL
jgi:hypothetical protein